MNGTHRIAILVTAFAALLGLAPGTASAADSHQVAVIAHRGSGAMAPENTLASVQLALKQGADYIENDIMRTSDGALVIMHDLTLARTTNVEQVFPDRSPWNVSTFTLAEIKQLDAGSWFSAKYAGQRVPTLREWVEEVGSRAGMLLEAKDPWAFLGIERDIDTSLRSIPAFTVAT
jgi:glycerophosphoryl diester phosphodiesterase